jgi:hypothetical protein
MIRGVASVRKIETGLECCRWLSRKMRNTVLLLEREKKGAALEIAVADSRGGTFSAFA